MPAAMAAAGWPGGGVGIWAGHASAASPESPAGAVDVAVRGVAPGAPDDALVALLLAGDDTAEQALAVLYERYAGAVYGLALRMLTDASGAEEVLQETFWRLWRYAGHYQAGRVRFVTWLLRVATNLAISEQRRRSRRPRTSPLVPAWAQGAEGTDPGPVQIADPEPEVPQQVWMAEQRRTVSAGLATLPRVQRQAVELAYFGGMTHAQIAATQGAPLSTVKTRLALGLRKMADFLKLQNVTLQDCLG